MANLLDISSMKEVALWRKFPGYAATKLLHDPTSAREEERCELIPLQRIVANRAWDARSSIIVACRGFGKTRLAATIAILKAWLWPGRRVGCLSASFRQAKQIFEEIQKIWARSPLLQQCTTRAPVISNDACKLDFKPVAGNDPSTIRALPLADGSKIRGARFHTIIVDECVHVPEDVFNMVIRPMAATHQDPVRSMRFEIEKQTIWKDPTMSEKEKLDAIKRLEGFVGANQIILLTSGYYSFNYVYNLYCKYSDRMFGRFDRDDDGWDDYDDTGLEIDGQITLPDWDRDDSSDYATFQIPYKAIPSGFLDVKGLREAKRDMSSLQFRMEYEAAWIVETGGWFKPTDIAACRANRLGLFDHQIELIGTPGKSYIITIDPARLSDAFAILVSEFDPSFGMKIVYAEQFFGQEAAAPKMVERIFGLCRKYGNVIRIGMDKGGGGQQIADFLASDRIDGQLPIYDMNNDTYRGLRGRHILQLVDFSSSWIEAAHNNAANLLERRRICFPTSRLDGGQDDAVLKGYKQVQDTLEKMISQILSIQVSETRLGSKLRFDLPSQGGRYEKHKDLYSAWLIGCDIIYNMVQSNAVTTYKMPLLGIIVPMDRTTGGWA